MDRELKELHRGAERERERLVPEPDPAGAQSSFGEPCPVCGEPFQMIIGPGCDIMSPDEGEWCFKDGQFFVHETFKYTNEP